MRFETNAVLTVEPSLERDAVGQDCAAARLLALSQQDVDALNGQWSEFEEKRRSALQQEAAGRSEKNVPIEHIKAMYASAPGALPVQLRETTVAADAPPAAAHAPKREDDRSTAETWGPAVGVTLAVVFFVTLICLVAVPNPTTMTRRHLESLRCALEDTVHA